MCERERGGGEIQTDRDSETHREIQRERCFHHLYVFGRGEGRTDRQTEIDPFPSPVCIRERRGPDGQTDRQTEIDPFPSPVCIRERRGPDGQTDGRTDRQR